MGIYSCIGTIVYGAGLNPQMINLQLFTSAFGCLLAASVFCLGYGYFTRWGQPKTIETTLGSPKGNSQRNSNCAPSVADFFSRKYTTIPSASSYEMAIQLMESNSVKYGVVVDSQGQLTSLADAETIEHSVPARERRKVIANSQAKTIALDAAVGEAVALFIETRQSFLPVTNDGEVVGILIYDEVVEKLANFTLGF